MTTRCRCCGHEVVAGAFCTRCGANLTPERCEGPQWLRLRHFAAAPNQGVLLPDIATTLFPRLARRSRTVFSIGLAVMLVTLLGLTALRVTPAVIAVGALGIPLLFAQYLRVSGALRDIPNHLVALSAVVGAGLGSAGMLATGGWLAHSSGISLTAGIAWSGFLLHGLAIPLGSALLKVVPAGLARLLSRPPREALDGFAVGAVGALAFSAAATLTRLAPQFATGWIAQRRSIPGLIIEAVIAGVTVPLTAAAAGGTVGVALWFTPKPDSPRADRRLLRGVLIGLTVVVLIVFIGVVSTDAAALSNLDAVKALLVHFALAVVAGLTLRLALQIALLHEDVAPERQRADQCGFCMGPMFDTAFCPACGEAAAAIPSATGRPASPGRVLGTWAMGNAVVAAALVGLSVAVTTKPPQYSCPPDCGRPPISTPVTDLPRYTAPDGRFTVSYPGAGTAYDVTLDDARGVTARLTVGDGGVLRLFSVPAAGRPAHDIGVALLKKEFPDAVIDYEIPNAMVGYRQGWGAAADRWPQSSASSYLHLRILLLVAVKNDVALAAAAVGPFQEFGPDTGPGLPSGANLMIAQDMGKYVNSFRWKGDPLD